MKTVHRNAQPSVDLHAFLQIFNVSVQRSEERRVGKERRSRWSTEQSTCKATRHISMASCGMRMQADAALLCAVHFFFSSRRRHTRFSRDWSSDVCSSDLPALISAAICTRHPPSAFLPYENRSPECATVCRLACFFANI